MKKNKRGLSPIIATVLLIAMILVIAIIIFLWLKGFTREAITKDLGFGEKNIELVCEDVAFKAEYFSNTLQISNEGSAPIQNFMIKQIDSNGEYNTIDLSNEVTSLTLVKQGRTKSFDINLGGYDKVILIPVLRGTSESGEKDFTCDERYGVEVIINE